MIATSKITKPSAFDDFAYENTKISFYRTVLLKCAYSLSPLLVYFGALSILLDAFWPE